MSKFSKSVKKVFRNPLSALNELRKKSPVGRAASSIGRKIMPDVPEPPPPQVIPMEDEEMTARARRRAAARRRGGRAATVLSQETLG